MNPLHPDSARSVVRRLSVLLRKFDALETEIDCLRQDLEALLAERAEPPAMAGHRAPGAILAASRHRAQQAQAREHYAAAGAKEIKLITLPNGAYSVLIDGQHRLKLPQRLGALLQILTQPDGASPDALVGYKSRPKVRAALHAACGCPIADHALTELVHRLRAQLGLQANLHRNFIMVHPGLGLRFALQQGTASVGAAAEVPSPRELESRLRRTPMAHLWIYSTPHWSALPLTRRGPVRAWKRRGSDNPVRQRGVARPRPMCPPSLIAMAMGRDLALALGPAQRVGQRATSLCRHSRVRETGTKFVCVRAWSRSTSGPRCWRRSPGSRRTPANFLRSLPSSDRNRDAGGSLP